jgi:hypothetical protein
VGRALAGQMQAVYGNVIKIFKKYTCESIKVIIFLGYFLKSFLHARAMRVRLPGMKQRDQQLAGDS